MKTRPITDLLCLKNYYLKIFLWKTVFLVAALFLSFSSSLFISCLIFVVRSVVVRVSFLRINLNWLIYTIIILYLGGIIVLFIYICRISSVSKIERTRFLPFVAFFTTMCLVFIIYPRPSFLKSSSNLETVYSLYLTGRQLILTILGIYLILGLLASIFFMEKLQGPLKSFYVK